MAKDLDILFINPPYERLKGFSIGTVPHGILGLATYLNSCGFNALVYDADCSYDEGSANYDPKNRVDSHGEYAEKIEDDSFYVWSEVRATIERYNPRFVGISLMTPTLHSGLKIASIAKELGKKVLAGGQHVTIVKENILKLGLIDYFFFGEGEYPVRDFLGAYPDYNKLKDIKGLGYKSEKGIVCNGFAERISDLNSLPFPDRELLVYKERFLKTGLSNIIASRGCPYACDYCASVPVWGKTTVIRSPSHIVQEIKHLHDKYNVREFRFFDDIFTVKKSNVIDFCKLLIDEFGEKYFLWWCLSRINTIDDQVLYWLKKAGCDQIHLGVESGSDRILKLMHKGISMEQTVKAVNLVKKHKFWLHTFLMIGFPYETLDDIRKTIDFVKNVKPDSVNLCTFTPYPGTSLYNYCVDHKLIEHDDTYEIFKYIGHHSAHNYFMESVSREEYKEILNEMLEVTSNISNSMTYRKFVYRLKHLTLEKFMRKMKIKCKTLLLK